MFLCHRVFITISIIIIVVVVSLPVSSAILYMEYWTIKQNQWHFWSLGLQLWIFQDTSDALDNWLQESIVQKGLDFFYKLVIIVLLCHFSIIIVMMMMMMNIILISLHSPFTALPKVLPCAPIPGHFIFFLAIEGAEFWGEQESPKAPRGSKAAPGSGNAKLPWHTKGAVFRCCRSGRG